MNNENWKKLNLDGYCKCEGSEVIKLQDEISEEIVDMCADCNKEKEPVTKEVVIL